MSNDATDVALPPVPEKWDRCHAYNEAKRRYCRQIPAPLSGKCIDANQPRYCGNHMHLLDEFKRTKNGPEIECDGAYLPVEKNDSAKRLRAMDRIERKIKFRGNRVPCPIDPSHFIFEGDTSKHILICPAVKRRQELVGKEYFCEGINLGGFGDMGRASSESKSESTIPESGGETQLAYAVLRVFHHVFLLKNETFSVLSNEQLQNISESEIYNALVDADLSGVEEEMCSASPIQSSGEMKSKEPKEYSKNESGKLTSIIAKHNINAGGSRHLRQIASILGHARCEGLISTTKVVTDDATSVNNPLIVEMGAGRGMTGLVVAGAMAASLDAGTSSRVSCCLVEKSGTRRKAERKTRSAEGYSAKDCLRLDLVDIKRVKADLADVDLPKALQSQLGSLEFSKTLVIAKHLCGAGTDLAIMSIRNLGSIDGCVMATCCHGLCSWNEYVGRNCLLNLFCGKTGGLGAFGEDEFNVLKRWTSAAVSVERKATSDTDSTNFHETEIKENHYVGPAEDEKGPNIFAISKELGLICGGKGLGRACQRLIDYGRCDYFIGRGFKVNMVHYVPSDVTPQNALIVAIRI